MMVIADTGPINYLISIGHIDVLSKLVLIPFAVQDELRDEGTPDLVRQWIASPPEWMEVRRSALSPDEVLRRVRIGPGEREAILLAEEIGTGDIILDDRLVSSLV